MTIDKIMADNIDLESMGIIKPSSLIDKVVTLKENPKSARGKEIQWRHVDFTLVNGINILTGIPGSGKSVWLDNIIIHSTNAHNWKWCVFSPENAPIENHIRDMVEIITGKNFYGYYKTEKITNDEIVNSLQFIDDNILFYHPKADDSLKIENMMALMKKLRELNLINAFVLDPYNEFSPTRDHNQTETEYVSHFLQKCRRITTDYQMSAWIVAHPRIIRDKNDSGVVAVPTAYDISGSANWYNKADTVVCVHRDKDRNTNPNNVTEIYIQKLKRKDWGTLGMYELQFNQGDNTYSNPRFTNDTPTQADYDRQYSSK